MRSHGSIDKYLMPCLSVLLTSCVTMYAHAGGTPSVKTGKPAIIRDIWGVPHIYAASEAEGFFAEGYAQAEDNLESILEAYAGLIGNGAASHGPAAAAFDEESLKWQHLTRARAAFFRLPDFLQLDYRAYVSGIEAYMRGHVRKVPAWAPHLEAAMPLALGRAILWESYDAADGTAVCTKALGVVDAPARAGAGVESLIVGRSQRASNEWVVAPMRSANHALIHLADPHSDWRDGLGAYELRMHAGYFHWDGFTVSGLALPLLGHNDNIAVAWTTGGPRTSDCYVFKQDGSRTDAVTIDGRSVKLEAREYSIKVVGEPDRRVNAQYVPFMGTLGLVVGRRDRELFAVFSSYMDHPELFDEQIYRQDTAATVQEFRQAMDVNVMFAQNVMVGDRFGDSLYLHAGRVPMRAPGVNPTLPIPASSATAWRGIHPVSDLIQATSPAAGYMSNENSPPELTVPGRDLDVDNYPAYLRESSDLTPDNARSKRAREVLASTPAMTLKSAIALATDEIWWGTEHWQRALRVAVENNPSRLGSDTQSLVSYILQFDGEARRDSAAAADYFLWHAAIVAIEAAQGIDGVVLYESVTHGDELTMQQQELLLSAVVRAARRAKELGDAALVLGDLCHIGRGTTSLPLGGISVPMIPGDSPNADGYAGFHGGEESTLRAYRCSPSPGEPGSRAYRGGRETMLTMFTDPVQSWSATAWGSDSNPKSKHYSDQSVLLSHRQLKPTYYHWSELRRHIESVERVNYALDP